VDKVAKIIGVTSEVIKNFNDEAVFNIISNTFHNNSTDHSTLITSAMNYQPTFNPLDEYRNEVQESKRLSEENKKLYEALLKAEREKVALLEKMLEGKK
jgi:hypothetical protein